MPCYIYLNKGQILPATKKKKITNVFAFIDAKLREAWCIFALKKVLIGFLDIR